MYCRECGKKVDQWVKFCPYCGAETNFPEEEIKKEEQAKKQSRSEQKDESDSKQKKRKMKISIKKDKSGTASSAAYSGITSIWLLICTIVHALFGVQALMHVALVSVLLSLGSAACYFLLRKTGKFPLFYAACALGVATLVRSGGEMRANFGIAALIITYFLLRGKLKLPSGGSSYNSRPFSSGKSFSLPTGSSIFGKSDLGLIQIVISLICAALICFFLFQNWLGLDVASASGTFSLTSMSALSSDLNSLVSWLVPQSDPAIVAMIIRIALFVLSIVGYIVVALEALHVVALFVLRPQARGFGHMAAGLALLIAVIFFACYIGSNVYLITQMGGSFQSVIRTELAPIVVFFAAIVQRIMTAR